MCDTALVKATHIVQLYDALSAASSANAINAMQDDIHEQLKAFKWDHVPHIIDTQSPTDIETIIWLMRQVVELSGLPKAQV